MRPYTEKSSPWKFRIVRHDMGHSGVVNSGIKDKTQRLRAKPLAKQEMRNANRTLKKSARQASDKDIETQLGELDEQPTK